MGNFWLDLYKTERLSEVSYATSCNWPNGSSVPTATKHSLSFSPIAGTIVSGEILINGKPVQDFIINESDAFVLTPASLNPYHAVKILLNRNSGCILIQWNSMPLISSAALLVYYEYEDDNG